MITRPSTIAVFVVCLSQWFGTTTAFTGPLHNNPVRVSLHSQAPDNAAAMTDFMAKAHEEKVRAMARIEDQYKGQIADLEAKVAELENLSQQGVPTSTGNAFAFPATNKDMTGKVESYRNFISDYIVKAQQEKATAVETAEAKLIAKYEAVIEGMKAGN
jgi:hypothetical protein